jgi:hypothetical protein
MQSREEHLAACKKTALEILWRDRDPVQAMTSMMSDMGKHPECQPGPAISQMYLGFCVLGDHETAKKFIEGWR